MRIQRFLCILIITCLYASCFPGFARASQIKPVTNPIELDLCVYPQSPVSVDRIMEEALIGTGYEANIILVKYATALLSVDSGLYDGVASQPEGFDKLYPNLVMIPESIFDVSYYAYARTDSALSLDSWDSLSGLTVVSEKERIYIENKLSEVQGIKEIIRKSSTDELIQAVVSGEADVAIVSVVQNANFFTPSEVSRAGVLDVQPTYTYLNKSHADLVPIIAQRYRIMKENNRIGILLKNEDSVKQDGNSVVLLISSYGSDTQPDDELKNGLKSVFSQRSDMQLYMLNLNSNRYETTYSRMESYSTMLRSDFAQQPPSLIIATDAYALKFLQSHYYTLFSGVPFIYCGVDDNIIDELTDFSAEYLAVPEKVSATETIDLMLKFYPDTERIFIVNDYLLDGQNWRIAIENQLKDYIITNSTGKQVEFEFNEDIHFNDLLSRLSSLKRGTLVLTGFYFGGADNNYQTEREIQKQFIDKTSVPVFGLNYAGYGYGEAGGKYTDRFKEGQAIGQISLELLKGTAARDLKDAAKNAATASWFFDYSRIEAWGMNVSLIPKDSTIINKTLTFHESNPVAFYLVIVFGAFFVFLTAWLLFFYYKLRKQNMELIQAQQSLVDANEVIKRDSELRMAKERIETLIESSPIAYILSVDGIVKEVNKYAHRQIGVSIGDEMSNYYWNIEDRRHMLEDTDRNGAVYSNVVKIKMKNGNIDRYNVNLTKAPYGDDVAYIMWGIDIEKVEQQKDYYQKSQEDMEKLIDLLSLPMFIFNPHTFNLIYANRSYINTFTGLKENEDYTGFNVLSTFPEYQEDGKHSVSYVKSLCAGIVATGDEYLVVDLINILPLGEKIFTRNYLAGITYKEQFALTVIIQDVTAERKQTEMLKNTAEREKEANQLKSRFIVNMSHEIRTPMNAIIGLSEIELNKSAARESMEVFQKINTSAKILLAIVNDILDFSKIEADRMEIIEEEYEMEDLLSVALLTVSQRIANKKVEMMLKTDTRLPKYVYGDKTKLWQILKNILDNSAKFTMIGHIRLTVTMLKSENGIALTEFIIDDTGIGMTKAQVDRIFQPFEQFHNQDVHVTGTGLGMTITKQLASLLGGELEIESEKDKGTQSRVVLPLKISRPELVLGNLPDNGNLKDKRILVLDDDEIACEIMADILNNVGAFTVTTNKTDEAFKKIIDYSNNGMQFDVIIVDYLLEGQNGFEFVKELKKMNISSAKLLMVSAYAKNILNFDIKEAGFVDLIDKPFIPSLFVLKICRAIGIMTVMADNKKKPQYTGAKVLVCEDNPINQEVAVGMLQTYGITPVVATNGREALGLLEAQTFDIIFMDIIMPIMNGHDAALEIRKSKKPYRDIPIVAMTANAMKDEIDKCMMEGMNGHIPKPIEFDKLTIQLEKWLPESVKADMYAPADKEHQEESDKINIRGVDIADGLARFGGKRDRYYNALKKFANSISDSVPQYDKAVSEENITETKRFAHTVKGTAGNLGITYVYNYAKAFDDSLKSGIPDRGAYELFIAAYADVKTEILSKLSDNEQIDILPEGSSDECNALLDELSEALSRFEPDACEKLTAKLSAKGWSGFNRKTIIELCTKVDQYDYDDAAKLMETLHGKRKPTGTPDPSN